MISRKTRWLARYWNEKVRWAIYGVMVLIPIVVLIAGTTYKPPQQFLFVGETISGGERESGTVISFQAQDFDPGSVATAVRSLDGLTSSAKLLVTFNSRFRTCAGFMAALMSLSDEPVEQRLECFLVEGGGIHLLPTQHMSMEFNELTTVRVKFEDADELVFKESGRFGNYPYSRDIIASSHPEISTTSGPDPGHTLTIAVQNQPGTEVMFDVGGIGGVFVPSESAGDDELLTIDVPQHDIGQTSAKESTLKLLYPDAAISFSTEHQINSLCLTGVGGRLNVGGKQMTAIPADTWRVRSGSIGSLSIINRQVTVRFDDADRVSRGRGSCFRKPEGEEDRRRNWLEMKPLVQGAVGFVLSALVLTPLLNLFLPRR